MKKRQNEARYEGHRAGRLTQKQRRFVGEYLIHGNGTRAAKACGYSAKTAAVQGSRLLRNVKVRAAVAWGAKLQLDKADLTGQMVVDRLRLLGFQDIRRLFDVDGNLLAMSELSQAAAATIGGIEVIIKNAVAGDGHLDTIHKIKIIDPVEPLALLAKRFGLLKDVVEHRISLEDLVAGSRLIP